MVNDAFVPSPISVSSPLLAKPEEKNEDFWTKKAREAAAQREYVAAQRDIEKLQDQRDQVPEPPEPPFKVTGGINLGQIDVMESQRIAREDTERMRATMADQQKAAQEQMERVRLQAENEAKLLREQLAQTNQKLQESQFQASLNQLQSQLANQINELAKKVDTGSVKEKSFLEQYKDLRSVSDELFGHSQQPSMPTGMDPRLQLELAKMKMDGDRAEREFKRAMRKDDLEFQRLLKRDDVEESIKMQELSDKRKRDELFSKAPEILGRAIAAGFADAGADTPPVAQQYEPPPQNGQRQAPPPYQPQTARQAPRKPEPPGRYIIEAFDGEDGVVDCPQCHAEVAVGPKSKVAVCAVCRANIDIKRSPAPVEAVETGVPAVPMEKPLTEDEQDEVDRGR